MTVEYFEAPNPGEVDMKRNHQHWRLVYDQLDGRAAALRWAGGLEDRRCGGIRRSERRFSRLAEGVSIPQPQVGAVFRGCADRDVVGDRDQRRHDGLLSPRESSFRSTSGRVRASRIWTGVRRCSPTASGRTSASCRSTNRPRTSSRATAIHLAHASLELLYGEKTGDRSRGSRHPPLELGHLHGRREWPQTCLSRGHPCQCKQGRRRGRALADRRLWRLCAPLFEGDGEPAVAWRRRTRTTFCEPLP